MENARICRNRWYGRRVNLHHVSFYALLALRQGPLHGYAIIKYVEGVTEGEVRISATTLYGSLDRLSKDGFVERRGEEMVAGRARRYYAITPEGEDALRAHAAQMRSLSTLVLAPPAPDGASA